MGVRSISMASRNSCVWCATDIRVDDRMYVYAVLYSNKGRLGLVVYIYAILTWSGLPVYIPYELLPVMVGSIFRD